MRRACQTKTLSTKASDSGSCIFNSRCRIYYVCTVSRGLFKARATLERLHVTMHRESIGVCWRTKRSARRVRTSLHLQLINRERHYPSAILAVQPGVLSRWYRAIGGKKKICAAIMLRQRRVITTRASDIRHAFSITIVLPNAIALEIKLFCRLRLTAVQYSVIKSISL